MAQPLKSSSYKTEQVAEPIFPLAQPPTCLKCGSVGDLDYVRQNNHIGNAGRPYYICINKHFITFNDKIGIIAGNPLCRCNYTSRLSTRKDGDGQFYCCPTGSCFFTRNGPPLPTTLGPALGQTALGPAALGQTGLRQAAPRQTAFEQTALGPAALRQAPRQTAFGQISQTHMTVQTHVAVQTHSVQVGRVEMVASVLSVDGFQGHIVQHTIDPDMMDLD